MERYLCIHGHFYQPPRENPWLEAVELQDSAYPFHDWNERITAECYAPNGASRILDDGGRSRLVNNYSRISFNFGPTLLAWMKDKAPDIYRSILEADALSRDRFSGHGCAIAPGLQPHHPAAGQPPRQVTQVAWGMRDFEHRFGRRAEGIWLAETAVDLETLDVLADSALIHHPAPLTGAACPPLAGQRHWTRLARRRRRASTRLGPTSSACRPGRSLALFFYDGPISRAVAFEGLLNARRRPCCQPPADRLPATSATGRNSSTSPPTAKATATTTRTATWPSPMPWNTSPTIPKSA